MGDLASVKVWATIWRDGPVEKSYHWMVKLMKPDPKEGVPNLCRMIGAFDREMRVYKDILPALNEVSVFLNGLFSGLLIAELFTTLITANS